tara:strand:+ start:1085 stop:2152 length:1068 start_codon:yes stop_codon:yes gene_type:complete
MNNSMYKIWTSVIALSLFSLGINSAVEQTGTGCANGTQYCENNTLETENTTTTTNTNTNTNVNTNTNNNTNNNTNTNANTNVNTNTNNSTNANTNVNTSTNSNANTNVNTSTANNTSTNANTNTNNSTSNNTSNVTQAVTNNSTSNNTNNSTSTANNTNSNTNVNNSTSDSNVKTNNTNSNTNNNNSVSANTNRNINQSNSTQTINQNVTTKAPPASAIAPSIMSYSQDLCTVGRSGAFQGQVFGFSTGGTVTDQNCERLKLSKYLYDTGMKVASVSILCQDSRVFKAMEMAGTPCPYKGKIGKEASTAWKINIEDRPDYTEVVAKYVKKCKQTRNTNGKKKSKNTCIREFNVRT